MPSEPEPQTFELHLYGVWAGNVVWDADGRRLVWNAGYEGPCASPENGEMRPSPNDWGTFWTILDTTDVWSWKEEYRSRCTAIHDGGWSLTIRRGTRHLHSHGNVFADPPGWDLFTRSVDALIGRVVTRSARSDTAAESLTELLALARSTQAAISSAKKPWWRFW